MEILEILSILLSFMFGKYGKEPTKVKDEVKIEIPTTWFEAYVESMKATWTNHYSIILIMIVVS